MSCSKIKINSKVAGIYDKEGVKGSFLLYDYNAKKVFSPHLLLKYLTLLLSLKQRP
jgi:hypothetical protein